MRFEILTDGLMFKRGAAMLDAMIAAAPMPVDVRPRWSGQPCVMMVYGTGHPVRRPQQMANLAVGGRLIGWDLGYWGGKGAMRATIDHDHPHALIRPEPSDRWDSAGIELRDDAQPHGRVVVVGMGPKSHIAFGLRGLEWESRALAAAARAYPDRPIVFRPKRPTDPQPDGGWPRAAGIPIEAALHGASLVVCRHSNVAIDACIAGVPVVCSDGAAFALYSNDLKRPTIPTREQRLQFLRSLAYWQWKPEEAVQAWTYLVSRLSG